MKYMLEIERYNAANGIKETKQSKKRREKKALKKGPDDTISNHSEDEKKPALSDPILGADGAKASVKPL